MFDKRKDNAQPIPTPKEQSVGPGPQQQPSPPAPSATHGPAVVGAGLSMNGELSGKEDVIVAGRFEGSISLPDNSVVVSTGGNVDANISAHTVQIEGIMTGDIQGGDKVVIAATGQMEGKIVAPRVVLADGAKFKGSIDMDPPAVAKQPKPQSTRALPAADGKPSAASSRPVAGQA